MPREKSRRSLSLFPGSLWEINGSLENRSEPERYPGDRCARPEVSRQSSGGISRERRSRGGREAEWGKKGARQSREGRGKGRGRTAGRKRRRQEQGRGRERSTHETVLRTFMF